RTMPGDGGGAAANVAVTSRSASIVSAHCAVPEHAPDQPVNVELASATATSCTAAPAATFCVHCALQSIAGLEDRMLPEPSPTTCRFSACVEPPLPDPPPELPPHPKTIIPPKTIQPIARM